MGTHPIFESDFDCLTGEYEGIEVMRNFVVFIYILVKGRNAVDTIDCPGTSNGETPDICVVQRSQKLSINCVTDQLQEEIINSDLQDKTIEFKVFKSLKKKSSDIFRIMEYEVIGGEIDTRSIWANNKKYFSTDRVTP